MRLAPIAMLGLAGLAACNPLAPTIDPTAMVEGVEAELAVRMSERDAARPIRLRTRDGIDLPLLGLEVRATVEDPLAFTEMHLEFENQEPHELEATLRVQLPADARVTRFAAFIEGSWREAEVVDRARGSLRPSLFEPAAPWVETGPTDDQIFEVVLPELPARSVQKLILSYAETFEDDDDVYRIGLVGLREVPRFSARVAVHGQADPRLADLAGLRKASELTVDEHGVPLIEFARFDWTPRENLQVPISGRAESGVRHGRKVAARIKPLTHDHQSPIEGLTILFDTSASRAIGYPERVRELEALVAELARWTGGEVWVRLIAFDQGFETIHDGPLASLGTDDFERLRKRRALGASNLVSVLRHTAARRGGRVDRVLLISDAQVTAGVQGRHAVLESVSELGDAGIRRIDVLADADSDEWLSRNIVRRLPESGLVMDGSEGPRRLARRLVRAVHDDVQISVPGARWFQPEVVHGIQSDDEILVFADVATSEDSLRVTVDSHGKDAIEVPLLDVEEPLVDWALAQARVEFLVTTLEEKAEGQSPLAREKLWRKIVTTSREHRVLNPYTRLAMLANPEDYSRAQLDPAALPAVLFAGPSEVQRRRRALPSDSSEPTRPGARGRLPRFSEEGLATEQLRLLVGEDDSASPAKPDPELFDSTGPLHADAAEIGAILVDGEAPPPIADPIELEIDRLRRAQPFVGRGRARVDPPQRRPEDAYHGNLLAVMNLLDWEKRAEAKQVALAWREAEPTDLMAIVALGEALEANDELEEAARAYASIIDLHPDRADMRRFAGSRLDQLGSVGGRLAIDTYRRAREQRPDHPSGHRLLAFSLLRAGRSTQAFRVLEAALERDWSQSFPGVETVLREDLGLAGAAWIRAEPEQRELVEARMARFGARVEVEPSLRFVLTWETGANDVDLHVRDALGSHAYYDNRSLRSGGVLQYDVTDGWGPEVFSIIGEATGYPYNLQVHYYARGPNGFGMGKVQILEHDGKGGLAFDERPFVVMKDRAQVDLGDLDGPLGR